MNLVADFHTQEYCISYNEDRKFQTSAASSNSRQQTHDDPVKRYIPPETRLGENLIIAAADN